MKRLVVGVDGSENSRQALAWAVERARREGAELRVVHAWAVPPMSYGPWPVHAAPAFDPKPHFAQAAKATVDRVLADVDHDGVPVEVRLVTGHAGEALVREGRDAAMVVVGHRGRGALAQFVLGSTAQYVSGHATVPVVVVPERALVGARVAA